METAKKHLREFDDREVIYPIRVLNDLRLLSLWDIMQHFATSRFCSVYSLLRALETEAAARRIASGGEGGDSDILVAATEALQSMKKQCEEYDLCESIEHIRIVLYELGLDPASKQLFSLVESQTRGVRLKIAQELKRRKFLWVNNTLSQYIDNDDLFGPDVNSAFPSVQFDIKESGNCLAVGCSTAAVFHLMRVAELGLRTLAWDRRIKFRKDSPLELKQWGDIFKGLEDAEKQLQSFPKTKARESQFEFYHGALVEFRAFKNLYRDRNAHARRVYDEYEARSALEHVSSFMRILATKISEKKRTPLIWRKA